MSNEVSTTFKQNEKGAVFIGFSQNKSTTNNSLQGLIRGSQHGFVQDDFINHSIVFSPAIFKEPSLLCIADQTGYLKNPKKATMTSNAVIMWAILCPEMKRA